MHARTLSRVIAALLLAHVPALALVAQTATASGDTLRLRVTGPAGDRYEGRAARLTKDTIAIVRDEGAELLTFPRATVRLEQSDGWHRNAGRGARYGFLAGALYGGLAGAFASCTGECDVGPKPHTVGAMVFGVILIGLPMAGLGAITGALIRTERWRPLGSDIESMRFGVAPQRGGVRLTISMR